MSRSRLWTPLRRLRGGREVHFWHLARSFGRCEVCVVRLEASPSRKNAVRKLLHVGVVVLQGVVIALAFDGDAVLGACEFVLQAQKVFVRLQLRIIFHDQQQAADRGKLSATEVERKLSA